MHETCLGNFRCETREFCTHTSSKPATCNLYSTPLTWDCSLIIVIAEKFWSISRSWCSGEAFCKDVCTAMATHQRQLLVLMVMAYSIMLIPTPLMQNCSLLILEKFLCLSQCSSLTTEIMWLKYWINQFQAPYPEVSMVHSSAPYDLLHCSL